MNKRLFLIVLACTLLISLSTSTGVFAGERPIRSGLRVLPGISSGGLTIFPVIADSYNDTSAFITLDEGLRSGKVVVTEGARVQGLRRGHSQRPIGGDQVNRLVLVNNSDRPLLLLAGEIVTGGKQDRVVAKDRIIPPDGDSVDLSVFCVEPGRWTEKTANFGGLSNQMAQPQVRAEAMGAKDQQKVWDAVNDNKARAAKAAPSAARELADTSSYATVAGNVEVNRKLDDIVVPISRSYEKVLRELRNQNAVGVVVAVNGRMLWADVFASPQLLQKYWTKLIRSYAAEAMGSGWNQRVPDSRDAQAFIDQMQGLREMSETDPDVFRHTEIIGSGYRVFVLTSLLPRTGFPIHTSKMAEDRVEVGGMKRNVRPRPVD